MGQDGLFMNGMELAKNVQNIASETKQALNVFKWAFPDLFLFILVFCVKILLRDIEMFMTNVAHNRI